MPSPARRSRVALLLAMTFVFATLASSISLPPTAKAQATTVSTALDGGQVNASFLIAPADESSGVELTGLYIINTLQRDFDLDVLIFLYDDEQIPVGCGRVNLIRNDVALVAIALGTLTAVGLVVVEADDDFLQGNKGDNERRGIIAYLQQVDSGGFQSAAMTEFTPIKLQSKMRTQLRSDFDEAVIGFDCANNVVGTRPAKDGMPGRPASNKKKAGR